MAVDLQPSLVARKIASLNLLITSTVWRQDHNGFTHQDPGFLDVVLNKSAAVTRIYLPPDANCLLSVANHCLRSENYINVIVSDKQLHLQYLNMDAAIEHCTKGIGIWDWASNDQGAEPDRGDGFGRRYPHAGGAGRNGAAARGVPRPEDPFHQRGRSVQAAAEHGTSARTDRPWTLIRLFTTDKPIIFNFHGYPWLIHRLTYAPQEQDPARARLQGERQHQHADGTGDE